MIIFTNRTTEIVRFFYLFSSYRELCRNDVNLCISCTSIDITRL